MKREKDTLLQLVEDELSESKESKNWFSETYEVVKEFVVQNYYYIGIVLVSVIVTVGLSYSLYANRLAISEFFTTHVFTIFTNIRGLFESGKEVVPKTEDPAQLELNQKAKVQQTELEKVPQDIQENQNSILIQNLENKEQ